MHITRKRKLLTYQYALESHILSEVSSYKYLGVLISNDLRWNAHVNYIVRKALSKLWYLRRNFKQASVDIKLTAYKTFIRSTLEYAAIVWDPYTAQNISLLESVQKRALRFIFNKYGRLDSVSALYDLAGLPTLQHRRKVDRLKFMFSLSSGHVNLDKTLYITPLGVPRYPSRNRNIRAFAEFSCRIDAFKYSFFPRTVNEWNKLPEEIVNSCSSPEFVKRLNNYL